MRCPTVGDKHAATVIRTGNDRGDMPPWPHGCICCCRLNVGELPPIIRPPEIDAPPELIDDAEHLPPRPASAGTAHRGGPPEASRLAAAPDVNRVSVPNVVALMVIPEMPHRQIAAEVNVSVIMVSQVSVARVCLGTQHRDGGRNSANE